MFPLFVLQAKLEANASNVDIKPIKTEVKNEVKEEPKPQLTKEQLKVEFSKEELRKALLPPLEKMYNIEPESGPFKFPVDPTALGIPDYFDIIKTPMDMTTIKKKLDEGTYTEPWEFVDDVWLMFENAWVYNRKQSRVYKYCSKVCTYLPKYFHILGISLPKGWPI